MTMARRTVFKVLALGIITAGGSVLGCGKGAEAPSGRGRVEPALATSGAAVPAPDPTPTENAGVITASATLSPAAPLDASSHPTLPPVADLPRGTAVLHVGDSFVHSGLTQALRPKLEALGVRYEVHAEKSTNSMDWAKRVPALVASMQPDLVIITLGGNEIGSTHLDVEARAVRRIVEAIGNRPCVWTTPPLWREELGVFDTIAKNLAPCRFFETDVVVGKFIPRREDKIHPTPEGGAMWADALYGWLVRERVGDPKPWSFKADTAGDAPLERGHRGPLPH